MEDGAEKLIPKHGGYRKLKSFQLAQLIYDVTVRFCNQYVDRRSRTLDRQLTTLASTFEKEGGFTERLYRVRSAIRRAPSSLP